MEKYLIDKQMKSVIILLQRRDVHEMYMSYIIAKRLKDLRVQRGVSQEDIAVELGMTRQRYLNDTRVHEFT